MKYFLMTALINLIFCSATVVIVAKFVTTILTIRLASIEEIIDQMLEGEEIDG